MKLTTCSDCGSKIPDKATSCPNCGCPVSEMRMISIICPECGKDISNKNFACPNCGYPTSEMKVRLHARSEHLVAASSNEGKKVYSKKRRLLVWSIIVASVLILISAIAFLNNTEKKVEITPFNEILYCEESVQLVAFVKAEDNDIISKTNVNWSSSDSSVASVDDNGNVTGISAGTVTITVAAAKDSSIKDSIEITVGNHVTGITIDETQIELLADSALGYGQVNYKIIPENAYCQDVVVQSSDENVVVADVDGKIRAVSPGSATITIFSVDKACTQKATCQVIVKQGVTEIGLSHDTADFYFGDKLTLIAEVLPENANNKSVVWTSSDETVATISEDGVITAYKLGQTDIICTAQDGSGVSAICTLNVVNPVEKIELSESEMVLLLGASVDMGKKQLVSVVTPIDATYRTVLWSSSDDSVAIVDKNGVVTGMGLGQATITATTTDPRYVGKISASCSITVSNAVQSIEFTDIETNIRKGSSRVIKTTIYPEPVYNSKLTWTSSDENVLKVDANGNVRAVNVGTAKITCTATDGSGVYKEESFTVYQPVTGLKAEETGNIMLFEGNDITLHATAAPADATNKDVEWTSDNPDVASVDASGCVTGEGKGTAVITATAKDGSGKKCTFRVYVEPALPITVESLGFGIYNGNLLGITVKNHCSKLAIRNFDFDIELESYFGTELDASGSYSLGDNVFIGAGSTQTIKRTLSGVSWTQKVKITITGVEFTDGTYYYIPWLEQETWSFTR